MKTIDTLVEDILGVFSKDVSFKEEDIQEFGHTLAGILHYRLNEQRIHIPLRMSQLGESCDRKLWYQAKTPELAEPLSPETRMKFLYGDIIEALLLFLAKITGHSVEGQQDELQIEGVRGHRDAIVDGRLIDVKSASTYGFKKFKSNGLREDDPFGYLKQIGSYHYASKSDPLLKDKDLVSFLAMDKQLGNLVLDTYPVDDVDYAKLVQEKIAIINQSRPPARGYTDIPEGKSGNMKLGVKCSYCEFKEVCWPNLRTFIYSTGPVFLTHVEREPKVQEVKKDEISF